MVLLGEEAEVDAHFGLFGDSANLTQIGACFALNVPLVQKSFWTRPMELLGDADHVESCFCPIGDGVSVSARLVYSLRETYHTLRYHFG